MTNSLPVNHPYRNEPPLLLFSVTVTAPTNGQVLLTGSSVTATVAVEYGATNYQTVAFYTNGVSAWSTNNTSATLFTIPLGALGDGTYTNYAYVLDATNGTAYSSTNTFTLAPDTTAPTPDPMTFAVNPTARGASTVVMTATTAIDALSPPVEYFFTNTVNGETSGWSTSTVWTNTGLTEGVSYGYRVRARDAVSNETEFSSVFNAVPADPAIFWDANNTGADRTDGNGTWLNANQWWNGTANCNWNNTLPNNAVIGNGSAGGTITLGTVTAGSVTFTNFTGTYTLTGGSLTQSGGLTIGTNSANVTISTVLAGTGGLTKNGTGTLTLSGGNSYGGGTTINTGTVTLGNAAALGNAAGAVSVASGAVLNMNGINVANTNALTLNGSGSGGTGALINSTGTGQYNGAISLAGNTTIGNTGAASLTFNSTTKLKTAGYTLTFKGNTAGTIMFAPAGSGITGTGSVVVDGAYLRLIQGGGNISSSDYTGTTTVTNGGMILYFLPGPNIGTGNINLNGGALAGYASQGFTRPFGAGSGQFQITGGESGFGMNGSATINFNNVTEVQWGTASFNPSKFIVGGGAVLMGGTVTFAEGIDLNGTNRTIRTDDIGVLSGVIRNGTGTPAGLIKEGGGTLTLSGNNTFNGGLTISAGRLTMGHASALGTGTLTFNGGGIDSSVVNLVNSRNNVQSWNANFTFVGTQNLNLGTGAVTMNTNRTVTVSANTLTVGGIIGDSGSGYSLTKAGAGTLVLTGTNSYSGSTIVTNGILRITGEKVLSPLTSVYLSTGSQTGRVDLAFTGTQKIAALYINGVKQAIGTPVGANGTTITGTGLLGKSNAGTVILIR